MCGGKLLDIVESPVEEDVVIEERTLDHADASIGVADRFDDFGEEMYNFCSVACIIEVDGLHERLPPSYGRGNVVEQIPCVHCCTGIVNFGAS